MNRSIQSITNTIVEKEFLPVEEKNKLEHLGFSFLSDEGTDRIVFSTGNKSVVKIARNQTMTDRNYDEAAIWNKWERLNPTAAMMPYDEDWEDAFNSKIVFCPVLDHGPHYRWIEMTLCSRTPDLINLYEEKLAATDWQIEDLHTGNIGKLPNGTLVCFDYPDARLSD